METVLHALFPGMHNTRLRRVYIANGESKKFSRARGEGERAVFSRSLVFDTLKKSDLSRSAIRGTQVEFVEEKIEISVYRDFLFLLYISE